MKWLAALAIAIAALIPAAAVDSASPPQLLTFTVAHWQPGDRLMQLGGICLSRASGAGAVRVLPSPVNRDTDFGAAWSRDGKYVAFARWFRPKRLTDVVVADARGRVLRNLNLRGGEGTFETDPSWSPDGHRLAFARSWRGNGVWLINRTGGGLRELVKDATEPAWSPDGRTLAFTAFRQPASNAVHTMRSDGTGRRAVLPGASDASWSPDGSRLAFISVNSSGTELGLANADGTERRVLTATRDAELSPAWSPDGKYIAFARGRERSRIVVMDAASGKELWVIRRPYGLKTPSWRASATLPKASRRSCG